jgi:hypothetical protein
MSRERIRTLQTMREAPVPASFAPTAPYRGCHGEFKVFALLSDFSAELSCGMEVVRCPRPYGKE